MNGFERRRAQSKEGILRAAEELFPRFGADKVSIEDIARKAGVSQATIYNNFGNKENLVKDYHSTIVRKIARTFRGIIVMKKSWVDKLQGFFQSWIDIADRYKLEIDQSRSVSDSNGLDEALPRDPIGNEIESSFREFIKEGKEQGNIRSGLSDDAIMTYIRFFQQGISNNYRIHDRMLRDAGFSGDMLSLFVYGIAGQSK
jgi:AcrR family transcriptional regulator